jgi:3-deoxy-D-arabino-heptulosonate 7-phosphate (DAHP) synthase
MPPDMAHSQKLRDQAALAAIASNASQANITVMPHAANALSQNDYRF